MGSLGLGEVKLDTIMTYFKKVGILQGENVLEVVSRPQYDGADPFTEIGESLELQELINRTPS